MRCRSLAGIVRNARCADLASSKSHLTLEVFETDAFPPSVFLVRAAHRLDFLGKGVFFRYRIATLRCGYVSVERFAHQFGSGEVAAFANAIEVVDQRLRQRHRYRLRLRCADKATLPPGASFRGAVAYTRSKSVRSVTGRP